MRERGARERGMCAAARGRGMQRTRGKSASKRARGVRVRACQAGRGTARARAHVARAHESPDRRTRRERSPPRATRRRYETVLTLLSVASSEDLAIVADTDEIARPEIVDLLLRCHPFAPEGSA